MHTKLFFSTPGKRHSQQRHPQRGMSFLTFAVFGCLVGALVYALFQIIPIYYGYAEVENHFQSMVRLAGELDDHEMRTRLLYNINKLQIPIEPDELKIERDGSTIRISLPYEEVFYVTFQGKDYDLYTFKFHAYAEGAYSTKRRG
jgi:hypothetical protein